MAKKRMYSFTEERQSQKGITSMVLGILSFLIFAVLVYLAYYLDGQGGIYLGSIGLAGIVFSIFGVIMGLMSFGEDNVKYTCSKVGSIINGIMLALWIFVIILGV